jgi:hypothetical protein
MAAVAFSFNFLSQVTCEKTHERMYGCVSGACALLIPLLFEGVANFVCVACLCLAYLCTVAAHCNWLQPASALAQHVLCTMCTILGPKPLGLQIPESGASLALTHLHTARQLAG